MGENSLEMLRQRGSEVLARRGAGPERRDTLPESAEDEKSCLAFGYLRGMGDQGRSLEFRFSQGNRKAFPYSWLGPTDYNPSVGLLLKFVGDQVYLVFIEGSNLNVLVNDGMSLYERGILRHRITWVREMTRREIEEAGEGEVTVERIRTTSYRPDEQPKGVEWLKAFQDQL